MSPATVSPVTLTSAAEDAFAPVKRLAEALLYEGYLLFPYRAGALKNRARMSFGELAPEGSSAFRRTAQTAEIPLAGDESLRITARVAFLQLVRRRVRDAAGREVCLASVGEREVAAWDEAREVVALRGPWSLGELLGDGVVVAVEAEPLQQVEPLRVSPEGPVAATVERCGAPVVASLRVVARAAPGGFVLRATLANASRGIDDGELSVLHSAHVALRVDGGTFASVVDPPTELAAAAAACEPDGAWFVLAGRPGDVQLAVASPIILSDHAQIAPESPADLFDATENDELLTLCLRALTDGERRAIAATDPRAAALLDRITAMDDDAMRALHGAVRGYRVPAAGGGVRVRSGDELIGAGDDVLLTPSGRDPMDAALAGRRARVLEVLVDVEGREHLVVVLDDDPGRDLGAGSAGLGHRFFVAPSEARLAPPGASLRREGART